MLDESAKIIAQLTENNRQLTEEVTSLRQEVARLTEQIAYLTKQLYGKSSEKNLNIDGQLDLFEEEVIDEDDDLPRKRRN